MNNFLCLHGLFQNKDIIKKYFTPLLKSINSTGVYIDAPYNVIPHYEKLKKLRVIYKNDFDDYKSWTKYPITMNSNDCYTLKYIAEYLHDNKDINGIIGFSQGAMIASLLNTNFFYEQYNIKNNINKIILISGFMYDNEYIYNIYNSGVININSIHIIGKNDPIIKPEKSIHLYNMYPQGNIIYHNGGHNVPRDIFKKIE